MEWISVEDRLPENDVEILISRTDGEIYLAVHQDDGRWYDSSEGSDVKFITHWMPLPLPPENDP